MKKILSVLIAAIMIMTCCSVGFMSFAATLVPATKADAVALIAADTEFLTTSQDITTNPGKWNENTYTSYPSGYAFQRTVNNTISGATTTKLNAAYDATAQEALKTTIANAYKADGSYADYITFNQDTGAMTAIDLVGIMNDTVTFADVVDETCSVSPVTKTTVGKSASGLTVLGADALAKIVLEEADLATYSTSDGSFTFADIDLANGDLVENSALAKVLKTLIPSNSATALQDALLAKEDVLSVDNLSFKITGIKVTPKFTTVTMTDDTLWCDGNTYAKNAKMTVLSSLAIAYTINVSADILTTDFTVAIPYTAKSAVNSTYDSFKRYVPGDLDVDTLITRINEETAFASQKTADANGDITHHTSGYNFSKTVTTDKSVSLTPEEITTLTNIVNTKYADIYSAYIDKDSGIVDFDGIIKDRLGLAETSGLVNKSVIGSEVLGKDALIASVLDAADVASFTGDKFSSTNIVISYNDVDILAADQASETSPVADMYSNVIPSGIDTDIAKSVANKALGTTVENMKLKYTNIKVAPVFTYAGGEYQLASLKLTYNVEFSADVYVANVITPIVVADVTSVAVNYSNFDRFVEGTDIDAYEFVNALNDASAYVVTDKAGYNYERNAQFTNEPVATNGDGVITKVTGALDTVVGAIAKLVGGGTTPVSDAFNKGLISLVTGDMNVTDVSATVPVTKVAADEIGETSAIKATALKANDIQNLQYNADRGVITFTLADAVNPEKDGKSALGNLTNDFVSSSEMKGKLTVALTDGNGVSLVSDTDPCDVTYTNINAYVAFTGADETNVFGDGTLAKFGLGYDCNLNTTIQGVNITADEALTSEANTFKYITYKMGDVDMSGKVSLIDARLVLQSITEEVTLTDVQKSLADMNADSKIRILDAKLILDKITSEVD